MYVSIRIKGHLDPGLWQDYLDGLQIVHEPDGVSRLCGTLPDQPALYGVLKKLAHLSLTLLSLESSEPTHDEGRYSPSRKSKVGGLLLSRRGRCLQGQAESWTQKRGKS